MAGGAERILRRRIKSVQSTKKITKAMELIAASRIQKAMARVRASSPFARAVTRAVSAVSTHSNVEHPLTKEREVIRRSAVVIFVIMAIVLLIKPAGLGARDTLRIQPARQGFAQPCPRPVDDEATEVGQPSRQGDPARATGVRSVDEQDRRSGPDLQHPDIGTCPLEVDALLGRAHSICGPEMLFRGPVSQFLH